MIYTNRAGVFYKNAAEEATTITATSEASASTPVENIATFQPGEKWRSSSAAEQTIIMTYAEDTTAKMAAGIKHNFSGDATVRYRISNNSDLSDPVYDATFYAWQSTTGWDEGGWDESGWDGVPVIAELKDWQFRYAHFFDLMVDFNAVAVSGQTVHMPAKVTRVSGIAEDASPVGEVYLGAPVGAAVQRYSHSFVRASSQHLKISNANFGTFDTGRFAFQADLRRSSIGTKQRIVDKQKTAGSDETFYVELTAANKLHIEVFTDDTDGELLTTLAYTGTSDFMTVTVMFDRFADTPLTLYVDGEQVTAFDTETQPVGGLNTSTGEVFIGADSAGANAYDGLMHNVAFFSGALPAITALVDGNGKSKELAEVATVYSLLAPGLETTDYVLAAAWTNVAGVSLSTTRPENYNQVRYVAIFNALDRSFTVGDEWSVTPEPGDTLRFDLTGAIETARNDFSYTGLYHGVTIIDAGNVDGYVELGYLAIGDYQQPRYGMDIGRTVLYDDPSLKFTSFGGATWVTQRTIVRRHAFGFAYLTEEEANLFADDIASRNGTSRPVLWLPFCEASGRMYLGIAFGLLEQAPSIQQVRQDYTGASYSVNFALQELR